MMPDSPSELAERYVIGAVLQDPSILHDVQQEVTPSDFADLQIGAIYAGMCRMAAERVPIDLVTVWQRLESWDVRGYDLSSLSEWESVVSVASTAPYHAAIVRDAALVRALAKIGEKLVRGEQPGSQLLLSAREALAQLGSFDAVRADEAKSLGGLMDVPADSLTYDWVIPDVLERKDRFVLTGSEGAGKSRLLRQMAILPAAGVHPFRFTRIDPVRVLVVDAENSERQWQRSEASVLRDAMIYGQDPRSRMFVKCTPAIDVTSPVDLGSVHRMIDRYRPDLLLIGPLYRLVGGKPMDKDVEIAPVLRALDGLRERGVAMLIEAHAGHAVGADKDRDLRPRGSSALLGWPEFGLGLRRDKTQQVGKPTFQLVRWRGDRDARAWPSRLTRHPSQIWPWEPKEI